MTSQLNDHSTRGDNDDDVSMIRIKITTNSMSTYDRQTIKRMPEDESISTNLELNLMLLLLTTLRHVV